MPKQKISEFSATPANNTDIDSINIAEGCAPSGINDAIRELMAQLKDWQSGTSNDPYVVGSSGSLTLNQGTANGVAYLNGSKVVTSGSALTFDGTSLGVGTASPSGRLHVANTGTAGTTADNLAVYFSSTNRNSNVYILAKNTDGSTLNFGDGDSSTVGRISYDHASNYMAFDANGSERMRLDSSGNLGLGVTPSAWYTPAGYKVMQIGPGMSFDSGNDFRARIASNAFVNSGGDFKYVNTGFASNYNQASGQHQWFNAASGTAGNTVTFTQAMTLDASGKLLLGTTVGGGELSFKDVTGLKIQFNSNAANYYGISKLAGGGGLGDGEFKFTSGDVSAGAFTFSSGSLERARIDSSGRLLVGKTAANDSAGIWLDPNGQGYFTRSADVPLALNRLANDGELVAFYQATTLEGNISVAGTTVSYNGGHLSRWAQTTTAKDDSLVKGTVLSNLDEMNTYTDAEGNPVDNEQLNKVKVSDTEGDVNVAGVFVSWSHDEQHNVDEINMAMTGDMIIRIAQGTTVVRGDLLMSAGNGTGKPQGDDIVRS